MVDIEKHKEQARELFLLGYNCAQSVTMAYADYLAIDKELLSRISISFGAGFGRQREICGTVSGAGILLGLLYKPTATDVTSSKKEAYEKVQLFSEKFRQKNGSIICRELLALGKGESCGTTPEPRTTEYYRRRPCVEYVVDAASIIGQMINDELTSHP
ncbi:MAG: C-GCAxxG-C-C family protein [Mucinivorans sp.]